MDGICSGATDVINTVGSCIWPGLMSEISRLPEDFAVHPGMTWGELTQPLQGYIVFVDVVPGSNGQYGFEGVFDLVPVIDRTQGVVGLYGDVAIEASWPLWALADGDIGVKLQASPVPEPETYALIALGLLTLRLRHGQLRQWRGSSSERPSA
jgi:hypothetical protein